ncbi:MAG: biotin carboxylase N-terminal domain-containing protein [Myxococcota bacterium]|nr:biotin carboxylase N-terminal domain-containing protein [Myxococcota bacterium]
MTQPSRIKKLAIVNRGEPALRCIRAVKSLRSVEDSDMEVVALYTRPDRDAPFVRHADRAIELPSEGGAVAAYLDHDRLIAALREVSADAVWPGWGFVSEDPVFVQRLAAEGILFLGPSAEAMRMLGDKITSKRLAEEAGVPVTPWSGGAVASLEKAHEQAARIGFPLVVKATAGGGGRGIRIVRKESELDEAFRSAAAEAKAAFGNGDLFLEKMVIGGRHIEVQIAADQHGHVIALGSRDCSVQRRHQKVIEEAPPPGLDRSTRSALEQSAVEMATQVGYVGVGTVEFLLGGTEYFFLEVNPRLQVEHGITEEITGVDLVQTQIRIARGESLADLDFEERGVAIEARVCAEDPDQGFLPSPGFIARFDRALGPRVRIDSGVTSGTDVSSDFDSLIAKVIAIGDNRDEARARLECALRDFELVVEGGASNKGYLIELLRASDYRAGPVDTTWLDRWNAERAENRARDLPQARDAFVAAAIIAYQKARAAARDAFYADSSALSRESLPPAEGQRIDLTHDRESYELTVYAIGSWRYRVHLEGAVVAAEMREEGHHQARLILDDRVRRIEYDASELGIRLEVDGAPYTYGLQTAGQVRSGTPAMVVAVHVAVGETVEAGQPLGLLEAMKMEIGFQAPIAGVVREISVHSGQQVAAGEPLLVIDPDIADGADSHSSRRLGLPEQADPLEILFLGADGSREETPDLMRVSRANTEVRSAALKSVREEVRRVILGYDANPVRGEQLVDFLEAPVSDTLPGDFLEQLAEIRGEIGTFIDLEEVFVRSPRASVSGESGPSNDARFRMYIRRIRAEGSGIEPAYLDIVGRALARYGVPDLQPSDGLLRVILRMFSAQRETELRYRLVLALLRRLQELAKVGVNLSEDQALSDSIARIARLRPQVSDAVADAALELTYLAFLKPGIERRAARVSGEVERWIASAEHEPTVPAAHILLEVAAAPRSVFDRVGQWISSKDVARREIALAAHTQRRYSPRIPIGYRTIQVDHERVHCVEYPERGFVLVAYARADTLMATTERLLKTAQGMTEQEANTSLYAVEVVLPPSEVLDFAAVKAEIEPLLGRELPGGRFTLGLLGKSGGMDHLFKTWERVSGGVVLRNHYDLHPETAERIDLSRYANFELERIPAEEGVYSFHGRATDMPADERIFVLADARDRASEAGPELSNHLPGFERVFYRATRSLRRILQVRDARRRLQWNRIAIFVAPAVYLDQESVEEVSRRLAPATRHLGLDKVVARLNLLDPEDPLAAPKTREIEIVDLGGQMEIAMRDPHRDALVPAGDYERRVMASRRNNQPYPYEVIKMLTTGDRDLIDRTEDRDVNPLPDGTFEEYDLDLEATSPAATSVAGRSHGENQSGVVLGVISTPTAKVPEGLRRVLVLSDPTRGMGALSAPECDRLVAAFDLAERLEVPLEWVAVSSGARISMDSGTENLDSTARVVRRIVTFTQAGGEVNLIVGGVNIGAQAYFDALATMLMHTRGTLIMTQEASMVLTGRRALEAAGSVSAEDELAIGGYERIMGPNGQAQHYAGTVADAYRILYDHYRYSYRVPGESAPRRMDSEDEASRSICDFETPDDEFGFATVGEIFDDQTNPGRKRPFSMRNVMSAVIDQDGGHLERWKALVGGETAIVWDAHVGGIPVELIGIESHTLPREGYRPYDGPEAWNGGTLFPNSSKKVARAINAASGVRPVIVLANLSGFDGSPESLRRLQLEYGAEIARAVVNFSGPILFSVVSRYHGGAYVVFSQELNPALEATALSGSFASVIGGGPAASVVFAREVRAQSIRDPRIVGQDTLLGRAELDALLHEVRMEKQREVAAEFDRIHSVERAREVGSLSDIVAPKDLRMRLIASLEKALSQSGNPAASQDGT